MTHLTRPPWRRLLIPTLCLALVWGALAEEKRPNILFLFTDDQPQSCLGISGNTHIQTMTAYPDRWQTEKALPLVDSHPTFDTHSSHTP